MSDAKCAARDPCRRLPACASVARAREARAHRDDRADVDRDRRPGPGGDHAGMPHPAVRRAVSRPAWRRSASRAPRRVSSEHVLPPDRAAALVASVHALRRGGTAFAVSRTSCNRWRRRRRLRLDVGRSVASAWVKGLSCAGARSQMKADPGAAFEIDHYVRKSYLKTESACNPPPRDVGVRKSCGGNGCGRRASPFASFPPARRFPAMHDRLPA
jgi:hypothetical protein